jgi:hypothetical protein
MNFPKSLPILRLNQKESVKGQEEALPRLALDFIKAIDVPIYSLSLMRTSSYTF